MSDISKEVREQVRDRSNGICEYCHRQRASQMHHIKKRSQGGQHVAENLIDLCLFCHNGVHNDYKFSKKFDEFIEKWLHPGI